VRYRRELSDPVVKNLCEILVFGACRRVLHALNSTKQMFVVQLIYVKLVENSCGEVARRLALRVRCYELADSLQSQLQLVFGLRVRQPDETFPSVAKRGPRQHRNPGFREQPV
jgi:hypothetical protein